MNDLAKFAVEMDYDNLWALNEYVTNPEDSDALSYLYDLDLWPAKFRMVSGFLYRKVAIPTRLLPRIRAGHCPLNPRWTTWTTSLASLRGVDNVCNDDETLVIQRSFPPKMINCLNVGALGESQDLKELVYEYSTSKRQSFDLRTDLCARLSEQRHVLVKPFKLSRDNYAFLWQKADWHKF